MWLLLLSMLELLKGGVDELGLAKGLAEMLKGCVLVEAILELKEVVLAAASSYSRASLFSGT